MRVHRLSSTTEGQERSLAEAYLDLCPEIERALRHEARGLLGGAVLQLEVIKRFHERADEGRFQASVVRCGEAMTDLTHWLGVRDRWLSIDFARGGASAEALGGCTVDELFSDLEKVLDPLMRRRGVEFRCSPIGQTGKTGDSGNGAGAISVPVRTRLGLVTFLVFAAEVLGSSSQATDGDGGLELEIRNIQIQKENSETSDAPTNLVRMALEASESAAKDLEQLRAVLAPCAWMQEFLETVQLSWKAASIEFCWPGSEGRSD